MSAIDMTDTTTSPTTTQTVCFAAPLLPGRTNADREAMTSCWTGERRDDHVASRRRHGITREAVWIQPTPGGDVAVVLMESADLASAMFGLATSTDDFDQWFRGHLLDVHGIDLSAGMNLPDQVLDYRADGGVQR